jgi:ubiquinone/menaquinone biosynthesis C-methylase UbiE
MVASALSAFDRARYLAHTIGVTALAFPLMHTWHRLCLPNVPPAKTATRLLDKRYKDLLERDLDNARRGYYPAELLHQFPTTEYLKLLPNGFLEFPRIFWRRAKKRYDDLPPVENRETYPAYYLRNFHWQTDGWLSDRSARLYDVSVEVLFMGTADVMRRMALPSVVEGTRDDEHPRILDLACGTGRFLRAMHAAIPHAKLYGVDLSPNYLKRAHEVLAHIPGVSLVQENAENLPFRDDSFDAVTSIFLFHELPRDARRNVIKEMFRVLRPGGTATIVDSAQMEESSEISQFLESFPAIYHEPYYRGYLNDSLGKTMEEYGFELKVSEPHFVSKLVVGKKP